MPRGVKSPCQAVPDGAAAAVSREDLSGLLRTTRDVESPGRTATARMLSETRDPTWNVKLASPAPSEAVSCCLQS